jgi:ribosomal-protein-alanine N-acetyltransferase
MIETERLVLRPWVADDRAPFAAMNADPAVMDFPGPLTREESDAEIDSFVERWQGDGFCFGAVERRSDRAFLGMVGLARCEMDAPFCPCVEIGWRLPQAYWGRGYASEAALAWIDHGFSRLGLAEIVAFTDPNHARSLAVMRRIGMEPDPARDFEHPDMPEGHPLRPHVVYAVNRDMWTKARAYVGS